MQATTTETDAVVDTVLANQMLDKIIATLQLKNDAALSRALEVAPPVVSKIRHARLSIGAGMIVSIHEITSWPIREIKDQLKLPCLVLHR